MELVQADLLDLEGLQRLLARPLEVLRRAVQPPVVRIVAEMAALGGYQYVLGAAAVGLQSRRDEALAVAELRRARRGGGRRVDQRDAGVEGRVHDLMREVLGRRVRLRQRHLTESDGADTAISEAA